MDERILKQLYEPFDLKERRGVGNKTFKYVPSEDIIDRMNKVFKGNWNTEVVHVERVEDQILIRVKVTVRDPDISENTGYFQEGYASHQLARYTSGPNKDKLMDIGNSYKSAMSKAIKTAVSKWGVGLYLESESDLVSMSSPFPEMSVEKSEVSTPSVPNFEVPGSTLTPASDPFEMPPFDIPPSTPEVSKLASPDPVFDTPFDEGPPIVTSPVSDVVPNTQASDFIVPPEKNECLTDIQKVAIETHMATYDMTLQELAKLTLQRTENLPTSLDTIPYQDAVKIIQNGNNLRS